VDDVRRRQRAKFARPCRHRLAYQTAYVGEGGSRTAARRVTINHRQRLPGAAQGRTACRADRAVNPAPPEAPRVGGVHDGRPSGTARVGEIDDRAAGEDEAEGIAWRVDAVGGTFRQGHGDGGALLGASGGRSRARSCTWPDGGARCLARMATRTPFLM
jgi:hypothetical protein